MKNTTFFKIKTVIARFFASGLLFAVLLSPAVVFGQDIQTQPYAVSSADVWSNGVFLRGSTGQVNYRWFEFGLNDQFSSFVNATPRRDYGGSPYYSEKITGLSPNTVYIFRIAVEVNGVRYYSNPLTFKTKTAGYGEPASASNGSYSYTGGSGSYFGNSGYQYQYNQSNTAGSNSNNGTGNSGTSNAGYSNYNYATNSYNYNYGYNSSYASSVVTQRADFLSYTSARLNAQLFPSGDYNVYGWFEWGTTPDLGNMTARVFIGKGASLYFGQILNGLTQGTTYYFKPVIENINGTKSEGTTLVFKTAGVSPYTDTAPAYTYYGVYTTTNNSNTGGSYNSVKTGSSYGSTGSLKTPVADSAKTITIGYASHEATVVPGQKISKKMTLENTTGEDIVRVTARVILPDGEIFSSIQTGTCKQIAGQVLFCDIGKMSAGQKIEIAYEIEVARGLNSGTSLEIITIAAGEYKDGRKIENFQRTESVVDASKENENMVAAAIFGSSDSSLRDVFIAIEFILLLILSYFVWKHLSEKNRKEEANNTEALAYLSRQEPVIPQKQNEYQSSFVTEKGIPPTNLPV